MKVLLKKKQNLNKAIFKIRSYELQWLEIFKKLLSAKPKLLVSQDNFLK